MRWPFAARTGPAMDPPGKSASHITRFAFRLFRNLASKEENRNLFFSPASVMLCLWMLYDGATGETRESMAKVLEVADLEPEALQMAFVEVKAALHPFRQGLQLEAANSLWCSHQWSPRSEYVAKIREHYDAELLVGDFRESETLARINSWVSAQTRGKIGSMLSTIEPLTALIAISAIYFKDLWYKPFEKGLTREELFHTSEGRALRVPFMRQYASHRYYEESEFQAIGLRYQSGFRMYIFLPAKTSSLREFRKNLNSATWDKWVERFEMIEGLIELPRFKLTQNVNLKPALGELGMEIAFDRKRARFDAINPPPPELWISQVFHQAFIDVNEEGTEAAAMTEAVGFLSSEEPEPRTFKMIVDRPFFFAICDNYTDTILFMGSVEEPDS